MLMSHPEQAAGVVMPWCRESVGTSGDPGERHDLAPPERRPGGCELLGHRAIILLGVQRPVAADGVAEQHVEDRTGRVAGLAIRLRHGAGPHLIAAPDRRLKFTQQAILVPGSYRREGLGRGAPLPIPEIAAAVTPIPRHVIGPQ